MLFLTGRSSLSTYESLTRSHSDCVSQTPISIKSLGRDHCPSLSISDDMPECGGGVTDGVKVAAADHGNDDDGEPARRSPYSKPHLAIAPALFSFTPLSQYTSFGRSRLYQLIADPVLQFPAPIKIGKSSRWLKTEVDNWLAKQADSRHQVAG